MRLFTLVRRAGLGIVAAATLAAPAVRAQSASKATAQAGALEVLAAKPILVVPTQRIATADTAGWTGLPAQASLIDSLDAALTAELRDRGLQAWKYADDVTRMAKRNFTTSTDAHVLAVAPLRLGRKPPTEQLRDPLASQLRGLIALSDARHVLIPADVLLAHRDGKVVATLRLVLIDARRSMVEWAGEVESTPAPAWSPAVFRDLATRVANMVVPAN